MLPACRSLLDFFTREYLPGARSTTAAADLPDGRAYYEWRVRHHTTLDTTPDEVRAIGLREVERIRSEMQQVVGQVGFPGSFGVIALGR